MIDVIFDFFGEVILVRVNGKDVTFGSKTSNNVQMSSIDGLKLSKEGAIKEFPELKNNPNWREEAIAKFKDKIRGFDSEEATIKYIIEDLKKFGYIPMYKQKAGFRMVKLK